jgi:hypothetical protein
MAWGSTPAFTPFAEGLGINGGTSTGHDTSGADTVFISVSHQVALASTVDSNGNTWTEIRTQDSGSGVKDTLFRLGTPAAPATVGPGHTFTVTGTSGNIGIAVVGFAGGATSNVDDQENSAGALFGSTIAPGSITPTVDNTLVISGAACSDVNPNSINGGFTVAASRADGGFSLGVGIAYLVQTSAAAANPTWTLSGSATHEVATIANFKAAAGGGGGSTWGPLLGGENNRLVRAA